MRLNLLFVLLFSITLSTFALNSRHAKVDELLEEAESYFTACQMPQSLHSAEQALKLALESGYNKGEVYGKLYMAQSLHEVGLDMEALEYLTEAQKQLYTQNDPFLQSKLLLVKGKIASRQKFYLLEEECYLEKLTLLNQLEDNAQTKRSKIEVYLYLCKLYIKRNQIEEAQHYQEILENELLSYTESDLFFYQSLSYAIKAGFYIDLSCFQKAESLLEQSLRTLKSNTGVPFVNTLQVYGQLEAKRGNIDKAIQYYNKALTHSVHLCTEERTKQIHKALADLLMLNEETIDEALFHQKEYKYLSDSLYQQNRQVADTMLSGMIKKREQAVVESLMRLMQLIGVILAVFFILCMVFAARYYKGCKRLKNNQKLLSVINEQVGELKKEHAQTLYHDIVELAKSNSPEFLPLFTKGYPGFVAALNNINNSALRSSELSFLALIYLGFSTKEIAEYTFVTMRAVQIRKNRLRKKYNISSDIDLNEWAKSLASQ